MNCCLNREQYLFDSIVWFCEGKQISCNSSICSSSPSLDDGKFLIMDHFSRLTIFCVPRSYKSIHFLSLTQFDSNWNIPLMSKLSIAPGNTLSIHLWSKPGRLLGLKFTSDLKWDLYNRSIDKDAGKKLSVLYHSRTDSFHYALSQESEPTKNGLFLPYLGCSWKIIKR